MPRPERFRGHNVHGHRSKKFKQLLEMKSNSNSCIIRYHNISRNWQAGRDFDQTFGLPSLVISGTIGLLLRPSMSSQMAIPFSDRETHVVADGSHWTCSQLTARHKRQSAICSIAKQSQNRLACSQ